MLLPLLLSLTLATPEAPLPETDFVPPEPPAAEAPGDKPPGAPAPTPPEPTVPEPPPPPDPPPPTPAPKPAEAPQGGPRRIYGRVVDLVRAAPVAGAKLTILETGAVVTADAAGQFSLRLPPGQYTLRAGGPPYEEIDYPISVASAGPLDPVEVGLFDQIEKVSVVEIAPRERPAPGGTQIVREEVVVVPGARGDLLTAVQNLPGVAQTGTFNFAGGLVIRGSAPADSRVFVDGVEVPFLFHFFNLQSILPSEMIDDVVYAPGGFGVEYGRASAGIIEVRTRRGRPDWRAHAEISFINAGGFVQGPLLGSTRTGRRDPTFTLAFRRSFIDAILPQVLPPDLDLSFTALPRYYDYQARIDWSPADRWNLSLLVFGADDLFALQNDEDDAADPIVTGARFRNVSTLLRSIASATYESERLRSRSAVAVSTGGFLLEVGDDRYLRFDAVGFSVRNETRIALGRRLALRTGAETETWFNEARTKFPRPPRDGDPRQPNLTFDPTIVFEDDYPLTYLGGWLAADVTPSDRLTVSAGLRYDGYLRSSDHVLEPRGEARLKLGPATTVRGSGGLYARFPDFNDEQAETRLDPERSWQATAGVEQELRRGLTVQATGFHIWRRNLIVFDQNRLDASERVLVNRGTGRTYGAELFVQARSATAFGWLAYTLSRSLRRDAPDAPERLFDFDQTHNVIAVASWALGADQRWRIGGRFQYTTGKPYTPVTGSVFLSDFNYFSPEFGRVNSRRYEAQHQLDLRIDRTWKFSGWKLSAYLDVTNVYAHPAPLQTQYSHDFSEQTPITTVPVLPAFGLRGEL